MYGSRSREHGLDLRVGQEAEDHHRRALGEDLHREQLDGEVARREQTARGDREVGVELRHRNVERGQVVAQRVEVARLVEDLARGGELGIGILEPLGELGGDDPGRQLAPHQHRDRVRERGAALRLELDAAVARHRLAEDRRAVPEVAPRVRVDAAQLVGALLGERERRVEQQALVGPAAERPDARGQRVVHGAGHDVEDDPDGVLGGRGHASSRARQAQSTPGNREE